MRAKLPVFISLVASFAIASAACGSSDPAAPENQIYLGDVTYRLVRDAVEVEAVEPLELKGKAQRVPAYRLVAAPGLDGLVRRHDRPLVGRDAELATLGEMYRQVSSERTARMVTLIGDAGFGKSRLVHEVIDRIARRKGFLVNGEDAFLQAVGKNLRELRKRHNLTLKQTARRTKMTVHGVLRTAIVSYLERPAGRSGRSAGTRASR